MADLPNGYDLLPADTIIEVAAIRGQDVTIMKMTYQKWKSLKRKPGYQYRAFQVGFSKFPNANKI